jgi:predicted small integral membrane protein
MMFLMASAIAKLFYNRLKIGNAAAPMGIDPPMGILPRATTSPDRHNISLALARTIHIYVCG